MARPDGAVAAKQHSRLSPSRYFQDLKLFTMHCKKMNWGIRCRGKAGTSTNGMRPPGQQLDPEYGSRPLP